MVRCWRGTAEEEPRPPQGRGDAPASRFLVGSPNGALLCADGALLCLDCALLCLQLSTIFVGHARRIGKQVHRSINIEVCPEAFGEALSRVKGVTKWPFG